MYSLSGFIYITDENEKRPNFPENFSKSPEKIYVSPNFAKQGKEMRPKLGQNKLRYGANKATGFQPMALFRMQHIPIYAVRNVGIILSLHRRSSPE